MLNVRIPFANNHKFEQTFVFARDARELTSFRNFYIRSSYVRICSDDLQPATGIQSSPPLPSNSKPQQAVATWPIYRAT